MRIYMYKRIAESRSLSCCAVTMAQAAVLRGGIGEVLEICGIADEDDGVNKLFIGTPVLAQGGAMAFIIPLKRFKSNLECEAVAMALQQKFDGRVCPLGCYKEEDGDTTVIKDGAEAEFVMNDLRGNL